MRLLGMDQKGLNINCAELFSPLGLLQGTASQVQGSHRSPAECSVSITGTSHGAITREAASHSLSLAPDRQPVSATHAHIQYIRWELYDLACTPATATMRQSMGEADVSICVVFEGI